MFKHILLRNYWWQPLTFWCAASANGPIPRLLISHLYNTYFLFTSLIYFCNIISQYRKMVYTCISDYNSLLFSIKFLMQIVMCTVKYNWKISYSVGPTMLREFIYNLQIMKSVMFFDSKRIFFITQPLSLSNIYHQL